jgi:hypothetical protein
MRSGKAAVVGGMPVLGRNHKIERAQNSVAYRDHLITAWHRERAAGNEVVLDVDEYENVHTYMVFKRSPEVIIGRGQSLESSEISRANPRAKI